MSARTSRELLDELRQAIISERDAAKALDLETMDRLTRRKGSLLQELSAFSRLPAGEEELARQLRHENRRNALLFRSTLAWIRQTLEFFGQRSNNPTYSPAAATVGRHNSGRLLSGRI